MTHLPSLVSLRNFLMLRTHEIHFSLPKTAFASATSIAHSRCSHVEEASWLFCGRRCSVCPQRTTGSQFPMCPLQRAAGRLESSCGSLLLLNHFWPQVCQSECPRAWTCLTRLGADGVSLLWGLKQPVLPPSLLPSFPDLLTRGESLCIFPGRTSLFSRALAVRGCRLLSGIPSPPSLPRAICSWFPRRPDSSCSPFHLPFGSSS